MISARDALQRLREGNERFLSGSGAPAADPERRKALAEGPQHPCAIILGCADSRVPSEIIFDQGIGDLFVIRVAGVVVSPSQIGSAEFAALQLGTRLVVVLGHTGCGAVAATLAATMTEGAIASRSPGLRDIVDRIRPSVEGIVQENPGQDPERLLEKAVRANVKSSADQLRRESKILEELIEQDGLLVVGAEYDLDSGRVDFFDGVPHF